jgi:AraC-like DNA-binding protein
MPAIYDMPKLLMLNVGHAVHDCDWNFKNVSSPFTRLYYVTDGTAELILPNGKITLVPGCMYIVPAFTVHTNVCIGHFEHYYIHIYEEIGNTLGLIDAMDFPYMIEGTEEDRELFREITERNSLMSLKNPDPRIYDNKNSLIECIRLNRERPIHERMESLGIIYLLMSKFTKDATHKFATSDPRIRQTLNYIRMNISGELTIDKLSESACISHDYFIRLFKKEIGITPIQYVINIRITKAQLMLATEDCSVKDVSYAVGYEDVNYFCRIFKKETNMSPIQYRNSFNKI